MTTENKILDRRQRKTKQAVQTALLDIMKDKSFDKITISELAERADINRKTFYNHYESIDDVRAELEEKYVNLLFSFIDDNSTIEMSADIFIHNLISAMLEQPQRAKLVFESGEYIYLGAKMEELMLQILTQNLTDKDNVNSFSLKYGLDYVVHGTLSLLNSWINKDYPARAVEIEHLITELLNANATILRISEFPDP